MPVSLAQASGRVAVFDSLFALVAITFCVLLLLLFHYLIDDYSALAAT